MVELADQSNWWMCVILCTRGFEINEFAPIFYHACMCLDVGVGSDNFIYKLWKKANKHSFFIHLKFLSRSLVFSSIIFQFNQSTIKRKFPATQNQFFSLICLSLSKCKVICFLNSKFILFPIVTTVISSTNIVIFHSLTSFIGIYRYLNGFSFVFNFNLLNLCVHVLVNLMWTVILVMFSLMVYHLLLLLLSSHFLHSLNYPIIHCYWIGNHLPSRRVKMNKIIR